jgi:hypothetical protein
VTRATVRLRVITMMHNMKLLRPIVAELFPTDMMCAGEYMGPKAVSIKYGDRGPARGYGYGGDRQGGEAAASFASSRSHRQVTVMASGGGGNRYGGDNRMGGGYDRHGGTFLASSAC